MRLKWYGTATILLEQDNARLLFDPFLSLNDRFKPPADELSAADNILVTHGHFDHITGIPSIVRQGGGRATVYCTAGPRETLISKGIETERIRAIAPGDVLRFGSLAVRVLKGKHIVFDKKLIIKTLISPRILTNRSNLMYIFKEHKLCAEAGETVVYDVSAADKRVLLLGSLNLDDNTEYPADADLLVLPLQGRSDIAEYAMPFIERLRPKKILLDHFDNTFPPISSAVDTEPFVSLMRQKYPGVTVIRPGADWLEV